MEANRVAALRRRRTLATPEPTRPTPAQSRRMEANRVAALQRRRTLVALSLAGLGGGEGSSHWPLALGGLTGGDDDVPSSSRTTELDVSAARVREARGRTCPGSCVAVPARGRGGEVPGLGGGGRVGLRRPSRRGRMDGSESGGRWVRLRLHLLGSNDYKLARRQATEANIRLDSVPKDEVNEVFQVRYRIHSDMAKLIPLTARNDRAKSEISALRTKWRSAVLLRGAMISTDVLVSTATDKLSTAQAEIRTNK
ncbi:hypothetical protein THAOC_32725, partial [Thalassiosira oceanica]